MDEVTDQKNDDSFECCDFGESVRIWSLFDNDIFSLDIKENDKEKVKEEKVKEEKENKDY